MRKLLQILLFSTILMSSPKVSASEKYYPEIFNWVKQQMKIEENYTPPLINMVSQKELQKIFRENNQEFFQSLKEEFGLIEAKKIMDNYVKDILGLFGPKTGNIYVGEFIEECQRNAIIAHETVHDLQEKKGIFNYMLEGDKHFFREIQAEKIQKKYLEQFCK